MDSRSKSTVNLQDVFADYVLELASITDGFVELRVYKSNNALENHDITTHQRRKGKIAADPAVN